MNDERQTEDQDHALEELLRFLKSAHGFDFTGYKRPSLARRVRRRMAAVGAESYASYRIVLDAHKDELDALFNTILVNVTSFFRDPEAWGFLAEQVVPQILRDAQRSDQIRVWSAGCASGEEPFSIAMLLAEAMGLDEYCRRVKVYATDWDEDALAQARRANYPEEAIAAVPEALRRKYFSVDDARASLHAALRRSVIFGRHDLLVDSPISRLDLLVCRNTMMYFDIATQTQILAKFHFALKERGYLFLGRAEMLVTHDHYFTPLDLPRRVFTRISSVRRRPPPRPSAGATTPPTLAQARVCDFALDVAPTAQVVFDGASRLVSFNRAAAAMHHLGEPDIGKLFQDLELSYRPVDLRSLVDVARESPDGTNRSPRTESSPTARCSCSTSRSARSPSTARWSPRRSHSPTSRRSTSCRTTCRSSARTSRPPTKSCRPRTSCSRPRTKSCTRPTRSSRRRTRSCRPRTRRWRPSTRSCARPTTSSRARTSCCEAARSS